MRTKLILDVLNTGKVKQQLLLWSQQFDNVVWLDSNQYDRSHTRYDAILAVDEFTSIRTSKINAFHKLNKFQRITKDWIFGYITYDIKNDIELLKSENRDELGFDELFFFQPKKLFLLKGNKLEIQYLKFFEKDVERDLETIQRLNVTKEARVNKLTIASRIKKDTYLKKVGTVLDHIHNGDIYEANFCQEFFAEKATINPVKTYNKLNDISKPPFATFLKDGSNYLLSASPERYIYKQGEIVTSQPIKGTAKRSQDAKEDARLISQLENNDKERSENIMIVDLVRNDLSKTAIKGSVQVKELCKVYTFKQAHQMISTIQSKVDKALPPVEIIKTTFPMGSMTGAPKISAMKIIEKIEETKRGLYSGCVGYFTPEDNFDFNVVIRSILYNSNNRYVSFSVGSAITSKSVPLNEYEECMIKAKAMLEVLEN